jgi:energy-coupling factor transport system ATP-binding protein
VLGPSGSGKSTLALAIAGLLGRDMPGEWHGSLTVGATDVRVAAPSVTGAVGVVFQDPDRQLVMDTAEDDVAFGLENRSWPAEAMRRRVPVALDEVALAGFERRRPTRLSGGEQQRLALAGVLAPRPGVIVLDEPTANLDPPGVLALRDRLAGLRSQRRATIVLIEHRVDAVWELADRVLALGRDGAPIAFGAPADVLAHADRLRRSGAWLPDARPSRPGLRRTAPAVGDPILTADGLTFAYPGQPPAVAAVGLSVRAGERIALVGRNGSGKSTLGRLLVGLLRPTGGSIRLAGNDPSQLSAQRLARLAGYVFQDPERQFLASSVADEVHLGLRPEEAAASPELLRRLGLPLDRFGARSPYTLSGGEQRRLSLACVLVRHPRLLVLDEPTFGMDRSGFDALLAILRDRMEAGTAVIVATHDRHLVAAFAQRVMEIESGRLVTDRLVGAAA